MTVINSKKILKREALIYLYNIHFKIESDLALKRPNQDWHKTETVFGLEAKTNHCVL